MGVGDAGRGTRGLGTQKMSDVYVRGLSAGSAP
jgi:hypothetical protein